MLAGYGPPASVAGWSAEPKLDGWRALVTVDGSRVTVRTRGGHDLDLPELQPMADLGLRLVLDGELVGGAGRMSDFYAIAPTVSMRRRTRRPTLSYAAFDVLWIDGTSTIDLTYLDRRSLLGQLGLDGPATIVPSWDGEDAADLLDACEHLDVEGVVLKRHSGTYQPGRRSTSWRKVKCATWRHQHAERRRPAERRD
jgi:bifunctional non-homologous end joining protein LigD